MYTRRAERDTPASAYVHNPSDAVIVNFNDARRQFLLDKLWSCVEHRGVTNQLVLVPLDLLFCCLSTALAVKSKAAWQLLICDRSAGSRGESADFLATVEL